MNKLYFRATNRNVKIVIVQKFLFLFRHLIGTVPLFLMGSYGFSQTHSPEVKQLIQQTYDAFNAQNLVQLTDVVQRGISLSVKENDSVAVVIFDSYKSKVYQERQQIDSVIHCLIHGYTYAGNRREDKVKINQQLGITLLQIKSYRRALPYLEEMVAQERNPESKFYHYNLLGRAYMGIHDEAKSIENFKDQLNVARSLKDEHFVVNAYNNLGLVYEVFKKYQPARHYLSKTIRILEKKKQLENRDSIILMMAFLNLSDVHFYQHQYDSSKITFQKTLDLYYMLTKKKSLYLGGYKSYISILFAEKKYPEVNRFLQQFSHDKLDINNQLILASYYIRYAEATHQFDILSKWTNHYIRYQGEMNDSILNAQQEFSDLIGQFYVTGAEQNLALEKNKLENVIASKRKTTNLLIVTYVAGFILFLAGCIVLIEIRKRGRMEKRLIQTEKENLDMSIELQKKDLSKASIDLKERTEIIDDFLTTFKGIEKKSEGDAKQLLVEKMKELKQFSASRTTLDQIMEHQEIVNSAFHDKLRELHPTLTQNDIDLCSYLILGLSTKDIANLKGITPHSVRVTKSRMKKKMELDENNDLENYLQNIKL